MATFTPNFLFSKPDASVDLVTDTLTALGQNFDKIDDMPLPLEDGSNTQLQYFKFANGVIFMWGSINHGTSYPCNIQWWEGYASANFNIFWPVALVNPTKAAVFVQARSLANPDLMALQRSADTTKGVFCYYFPAWNESTAQAVSKEINVFAVGRWK